MRYYTRLDGRTKEDVLCWFVPSSWSSCFSASPLGGQHTWTLQHVCPVVKFSSPLFPWYPNTHHFKITQNVISDSQSTQMSQCCRPWKAGQKFDPMFKMRSWGVLLNPLMKNHFSVTMGPWQFFGTPAEALWQAATSPFEMSCQHVQWVAAQSLGMWTEGFELMRC